MKSLSSTDNTVPRDLSSLFDPKSIAIVGASDDPEKYGNWLAVRALAGRRPAYLVNSRHDRVLGQTSFPTLSALDAAVDLAVIAVPARAFDAAVDDALASGVRAIVGITSGLGETGEEGRQREIALTERVRAAGAILLGPNCLGVLDNTTGLDATVNTFPMGSVALLSQSGNVAIDLARRLDSYGLGVSRFASLGNQADLDASDLIDACIDHDGTTAIALYCEGIDDGRGFVRAATRAAEAGKPVVLLTVGRSAASVRGAASHTGSLVTSTAVMAAACSAGGVEFVASPREMADLLQGLVRTRTPRGRRVAVIADGGGHASLASDALDSNGLAVEQFSADLQQRIAQHLPFHASSSNPVDIAGAGEKDTTVFERIAEEVTADADTDAIVLTGYFGGFGEYSADLAAAEVRTASNLATLARNSDSTMLAHLMFSDSAAAGELRTGGIAVYRDAETTAWVLSRLAARSEVPSRRLGKVPAPGARIEVADYWSSRMALAAEGIQFMAAAQISTIDELRRAAAQMQYPLVLKALGDEHKSDRGGVALNLLDLVALESAFVDMSNRLSPPAYSVEQMADTNDAVELIVGVRHDASFGSVVMVGLGGTLTEVLSDTSCALGPVDRDTALTMVKKLRGAALFGGFRGKPSVDIAAAAELIVKVSTFAAAHPEISEIECNPVAVLPTGAVALDARIILA